jgi:AAA domain
MNEVPPKPEFSLPRLGYDTPEEKAEKRWHSYFDGFGGFPERPEAFDLLLIEKERHEAYMSRVEEGGIPWEDAKRKAIGVGVKIDGLVASARKTWAARVDPEAVAKEAEETEKWREVRERTPEEIQAAVDRDLAKWEAEVAAKKKKALERQAKAELEAGAREGLESPTETEEEDRVKAEAKLDRMAGYMGEEMRRHTGKVVPLRPMGGDPNVTETFDPPQRIDLRRWSVKPEPIRWLVAGFIRPGVATLFSGRGGGGKGIISMTLATAMMLGQGRKGFFGLGVVEGPVFGLFCEDEEQIMHNRQWHIDDHYGIPHGRFSEDRAYYSLVGQASALAVIDKGTNRLMRTPLWDWLLGEVRVFPRSLTILDPVTRLFIGDFNDPSQAVQFSAMLEELAQMSGGAVLANFHPSRTALKDVDASDGVGHSPQWVNAFRVTAFLDIPDPSGDPDGRTLRTTKINDGVKLDKRLRWQGGPLGGLFVEDTGAGPVKGAREQDRFLDLFDRAWSRSMWVSDKKTSPNWAPRRLLEIGGLNADDKLLVAGMKASMMKLMGDGVLAVGSYRGPDRHDYLRLERAGTSAGTSAGTAGTSYPVPAGSGAGSTPVRGDYPHPHSPGVGGAGG